MFKALDIIWWATVLTIAPTGAGQCRDQYDPVVQLLARGPTNPRLRQLYDTLLDDHYATLFTGTEPSFLPGSSAESSARIIVQGNRGAVINRLNHIVAVAEGAAQAADEHWANAAVSQLKLACADAEAALTRRPLANVAVVARLLVLYDALIVMSVVAGAQRSALLAQSCFQGQTLLHVAARSGSKAVVGMLLAPQLGIADQLQAMRDVHGRNARMTATAAGFDDVWPSACEPRYGTCSAPGQRQIEEHWYGEGSLTDLNQLRAFLSRKASIGTPCIIRAVVGKQQQQLFAQQILNRSATNVSVHTIPYADRFIRDAPARVLTLSQYDSLRTTGQTGETELYSNKLYAFEKFGIGHALFSPCSQLMAGWHPAYKTATKFQFAYGHRGSGTPPHLHGHAVNVVAQGVKEWKLLPPAAATWSIDSQMQHSVHFLEQAKIIEIVQRAGDIVMVPIGWTHSTLNVDEVKVTISVSSEFHDADLPDFQFARKTWQDLA